MFPSSVINSALRTEDIEGLVKPGARNEDEYVHEAIAIASELNEMRPDAASEDRITAVMARIWTMSFQLSDEDLGKRYPALRRVARKIIAVNLEDMPR